MKGFVDHRWSSVECEQNLNRILAICRHLGVPLVMKKLEGPSQCLTFLGIEMDTLASKLRLPADKLHRGGGATYEESTWWAAAWVCFFGFFRVGEITVPTALSYDPAVHLSWGDVSISKDQQRLRVFLKRSKTDQYGRGTEVFIGATEDDLCPVNAACLYVARREASPGAFFSSAAGAPLIKSHFVELIRSALTNA